MTSAVFEVASELPSLPEHRKLTLDAEIKRKLESAAKKAKVSFLTGRDRTYFPKDPGVSRFGITNNPARNQDLPPAKLYSPSVITNKCTKPISTKGYGIGGLSTPRFHVPRHAKGNPGPNYYHIHDLRLLGKEHKFPPCVWMNYGLWTTEDIQKYHQPSERVNTKMTKIWNQCHQLRAPFERGMKEPRFGKPPRWSVAGPGHYEVSHFKAPKPISTNSFMCGPVSLNAPTKMHCAYGPKDTCVECGKDLMKTEDYYRSKYRLELPYTRAQVVNSDDDEAVSKVDDAKRPKKRRVLLCRTCHCKALRGESKYWKRRLEVEWQFEKTRHCGYIHEHNGLPDFTEKASCYWTKRLATKEALLSKYYPDKCEKRVIRKKEIGTVITI